MNILQLSRTSMYPPQNGAEVRVWKTAQKLAELGDLWVAAPPGTDTLPGDINRIDLSSPLFTRPFIWNELWTGMFLFGENHPLRRPLAKALVDAISRVNVSFDVVVCEFPQMTDGGFRLATEQNAAVLLNKHNAEHTILDGVLREHPVPDFLRQRATENFFAFERKAIAAADVTVFQSEDDRATFDQEPGAGTFVIPNGCDFQWIRDGGDPEQAARVCGVGRDRFTSVFLGSYDYAPNRQAATLIAERIAPALANVEFLLLGRNPPSVSASNVHAPGYVDDLPGALQLADVAICPLFSGSGTKLKMLDYFAAGLPVVTTPVGVQGLSVGDEREVLIYDDAEGMVRGIERLRSSAELRQQLAMAGREIAAEHSWETLMTKYEAVFDTLRTT